MCRLKPKFKMIHMRNSFFWSFILGMVLPLNCLGGEVAPLSREEIVGILRENMGADYPGSLSHSSFERYKSLLRAGETAYPALAEELLSTSDTELISGIVSVFEQSKGDKTIPRRAMRKFVELHGRDNSSSGSVYAVTMALGAIGGTEDADLLRKYLDLEDVLQRHNVENSIERIEKRERELKRQAEFEERSKDRRNEPKTKPGGRQAEGNDENQRRGTGLLITWIVTAAIVLFVATMWLRSRKSAGGRGE